VLLLRVQWGVADVALLDHEILLCYKRRSIVIVNGPIKNAFNALPRADEAEEDSP